MQEYSQVLIPSSPLGDTGVGGRTTEIKHKVKRAITNFLIVKNLLKFTRVS